MATRREQLIATYGEQVQIRRKRVGERPNISYVRRYICPTGHAHQDMASACLCIERHTSGAQDG